MNAAPGPDPGSFGGHPYTPDEIALGYGTDHDPRFTKPDAACRCGTVCKAGDFGYPEICPNRPAARRHR